MADKTRTKIIRAGSRTYFFDVRQTREGKDYLVITESRFKGEGQDHERHSIRVFPEQSAEFLEELTSAIWSLK